MAISEIEFKVTWENGHYFKFEEKIDGVNWITVLQSYENTHFDAVGEFLKQVCLASVTAHLDTVVSEMSA